MGTFLTLWRYSQWESRSECKELDEGYSATSSQASTIILWVNNIFLQGEVTSRANWRDSLSLDTHRGPIAWNKFTNLKDLGLNRTDAAFLAQLRTGSCRQLGKGHAFTTQGFTGNPNQMCRWCYDDWKLSHIFSQPVPTIASSTAEESTLKKMAPNRLRNAYLQNQSQPLTSSGAS